MKLDLIQELHKNKRDYMARMMDDKVKCMKIALKFDKNFFNGARRFGYGGYKYDGRWKPMAKELIARYGINRHSKVLDIGYGMGHLLYEIEQLTECHAKGFENSQYALDNCLVKSNFKHDVGKDSIFDSYDLVLCINVLHNLVLPELKHALQNIQDCSKNAYIVVESYRNEEELFNLQCWALTCEQFLRPEEWEFLFKEWGYEGDYEFIYFEKEEI